MSALKQYYECTVELVTLLQSNIDRDEKTDQVEKALEKRSELIKDIQGPYSDEEKELGKQLLQLEETLASLLAKEKLEIQKNIKDLKVKKASNTKYVNPYQNLSTDGMFYDKKK
ncbi:MULTISPECIES: flagellar protein FliT [unclassified Bacillus (in: firmicutes)]|uniref:flagellar protein FliT n=1 Tax=unclassified Bacillus (in: firmicutes) TaxID=185979 RepID=UPI0008DF3991|nr:MULTISPECIES: flagellar protein FliT [unclassified Bacillus (in: firmicutes)]SFB21618.1 flagellar protein FliT [Bacillus sp. UNCCL13]SFQ90999.1 flagellar protein FliT [Bacillus sp. cl95]